MNDTQSPSTTEAPHSGEHVSTIVRGQAVWTGIYALAALYFGWYAIAPSEMVSIQVIRFTLQYGGAGMLLAALVLLSGSATALVVDAVFSMLAGVGLAIGGVLLLSFNAAYGVVGIIFGYLFFSSGRRSMRDYRHCQEQLDPGFERQASPSEPSEDDETEAARQSPPE